MRRSLALIPLTLCAVALALFARPPIPRATPQTPSGHALSVVVIDPGHGGTDPGAHGANGAVEKDVVMVLARAVRVELERAGLRVIMTRDGDQNPSLDDRAAIANAHSGALFISLHVSSTGPPGTVRAYSYAFSQAPETAPPVSPAPPAAPAPGAPTPPNQPVAPAPAVPAVPAARPGGWTVWETAQKPWVDQSHRFADLLQSALAEKFPGSLGSSLTAPVRELRSVAAPAVAVEISSVTAANAQTLESSGLPLAAAIARAVAAFRPIYEGTAK